MNRARLSMPVHLELLATYNISHEKRDSSEIVIVEDELYIMHTHTRPYVSSYICINIRINQREG